MDSMSEMSPLQKRLLATYMDALKEQEEGASTPKSPAKDAAPRANLVEKAQEPPPAVPSASRARSDLYAKKMSELLLKGWKMLGENCPETGDVPLMQHPTTGRKFSIATGRYTDEAKPAEDEAPLPRLLGGAGVAAAAEPSPTPTPLAVNSSPAPTPAPTPPPAPPTAAAPSQPNAGKSIKRDDDEWSEAMSKLMLQGWRMLNEQCPFTGLVPLMQHPTSGRKFSVATKQYVDAAAPPAPAPAPEADQAAAAAGESPARGGEGGATKPRIVIGGRSKSAAPPSDLPVAAAAAPPSPMAVPPPTHVAWSAASSAAPAAPPAVGGGDGATAVFTTATAAESLRALERAAVAVNTHLNASADQLAAAAAPPPTALLGAVGKCAEVLAALEKARRTLLSAAEDE